MRLCTSIFIQTYIDKDSKLIQVVKNENLPQSYICVYTYIYYYVAIGAHALLIPYRAISVYPVWPL